MVERLSPQAVDTGSIPVLSNLNGKLRNIVSKMAKKPGLYENIAAKRKRIAAGSGEKMRKPGSTGAPSAADFRKSAKTAKKNKK